MLNAAATRVCRLPHATEELRTSHVDERFANTVDLEVRCLTVESDRLRGRLRRFVALRWEDACPPRQIVDDHDTLVVADKDRRSPAVNNRKPVWYHRLQH